jgi:hypothetical protein
MSKFIDKLRRASKDNLKSMGFTPKKVSSESKPLLLAMINEKVLEKGSGCLTGADSGLISLSDPFLGSEILTQVTESDLKIPWGGWLQKLNRTTLKQITITDYDFLVFPPNTPVTLFPENEPGKIIEVNSSISGSVLRVISSLPVDSVLLNDGLSNGNLTWQHLMLYQRFTEVITKPLIITLAFNVTSEELQLLWRAGVDGLLVDGLTEHPDRLTKLRQIIDGTAFSLKDRWGKSLSFLPSMGGYGRLDAEEE